MSKKKKCIKTKRIGTFIICVGTGVIIAVLIPIWGWMIVVGAGIMYLGYEIMEHKLF